MAGTLTIEFPRTQEKGTQRGPRKASLLGTEPTETMQPGRPAHKSPTDQRFFCAGSEGNAA